jgi:hypothetical protein
VREAFLSELDRPMSRSADVSLWHADLVSYPVEVPLRERPFDGAAVTAHVPSDTSPMTWSTVAIGPSSRRSNRTTEQTMRVKVGSPCRFNQVQ